MKRLQFPLSSDQLELLLAFEKAGSLESLSSLMAKDPSVVSRRLQDLAQTSSVIIKKAGRWQMTHLGRQINELSRRFYEDLNGVLDSQFATKKKSLIPDCSVLLVINAQKALHYSDQGRRNNLQAEENMARLLKYWRRKKWPVIHIKHVSTKPSSLFHKNSDGCHFIPELSPQSDETVLEKMKASAFIGTELESTLQKIKSKSVVLTGFTAGECIDATARHASDLEFDTYVLSDATATFDIVNPEGKLIKANKVHAATLAALHASFAEVLDTDSIV